MAIALYLPWVATISQRNPWESHVMAAEIRTNSFSEINSPLTRQQRIASLRDRRVRIGSAHSPVATLLNRALCPIVAVMTLLVYMGILGQRLDAEYLALLM